MSEHGSCLAHFVDGSKRKTIQNFLKTRQTVKNFQGRKLESILRMNSRFICNPPNTL